MIKEWYAPREIRFNSRQIIWILNNYDDFKQDVYPSNPYVSGYTDPAISASKISHNARFTLAADIYAEVSLRIKLCGEDGGMTEDYYHIGRDYATIAHQHNTNSIDVINRIGRCIKYCSGWKRKRRTYIEFCGHRKSAVRV